MAALNATGGAGHPARVDTGSFRNPSLNIRPDLAKAAAAITGPSVDDELTGPRADWWWTGKAPAQTPGFDKAAGVLRSLPMPGLRTFTRQAVLDYFDNTWTLTEVLFASLQVRFGGGGRAGARQRPWGAGAGGGGAGARQAGSHRFGPHAIQ